MLDGRGWNVIYWHNHDQPRVLSHYGDDGQYRDRSAKMLLFALYFMPGTTIVYQGEEIGMANVRYEHLDEFRDVEVFTEYRNMLQRGYSAEEALAIIRARCRDNARTPMQWSASLHAGFSSHAPWIAVNDDHVDYNVEREEADSESILSYYRKVLNLRVDDPDIRAGRIRFLDIEGKESYTYLNKGEEREYLVVSNFTGHHTKQDLSGIDPSGFRLIFHNCAGELVAAGTTCDLAPYEAAVFVRGVRN
jgi:glycosidase